MPDLIAVVARRWVFLLGFAAAAAVLALLGLLLSPRKFASTATAIPANSVMADKARIFNQNIEALYSSLGSPDELDRVEGTASLDTIYLAVAGTRNLVKHYELTGKEEAFYKAALRLKKNATISRSAYGELKVKVVDKDPAMAANLANDLMAQLQGIHHRLLTQSDSLVLLRLRADLQAKRAQRVETITRMNTRTDIDSASTGAPRQPSPRNYAEEAVNDEYINASNDVWQQQLREQERLIQQYELSMTAAPQPLIVVEPARVAIEPDGPKVLVTLVLAFVGGLVLALLLTLFLHSRKPVA